MELNMKRSICYKVQPLQGCVYTCIIALHFMQRYSCSIPSGFFLPRLKSSTLAGSCLRMHYCATFYTALFMFNPFGILSPQIELGVIYVPSGRDCEA